MAWSYYIVLITNVDFNGKILQLRCIPVNIRITTFVLKWFISTNKSDSLPLHLFKQRGTGHGREWTPGLTIRWNVVILDYSLKSTLLNN